MRWHKSVTRTFKDPTNVFHRNTGVGLLHVISLEDELSGKEPFKFSSMMFIPESLDNKLQELSLNDFYNNAEKELLKKHKQWRGRQKVEIVPLPRLLGQSFQLTN